MASRNMRALHGPVVTPAEFHILLALADRDRHGYAVMQQIAADSDGAVQLGPGTLYGAIRRLLDSGLIREIASALDPEVDDARRKYYRLTATGRAAVRDEAERLGKLVRLARVRELIAVPKTARGVQ